MTGQITFLKDVTLSIAEDQPYVTRLHGIEEVPNYPGKYWAHIAELTVSERTNPGELEKHSRNLTLRVLKGSTLYHGNLPVIVNSFPKEELVFFMREASKGSAFYTASVCLVQKIVQQNL